MVDGPVHEHPRRHRRVLGACHQARALRLARRRGSRMNAQQLRVAADLLHSAWMHGTVIDALPEACRPRTREEGYAIQALLEARSSAPVYGWKIAATSVAGQAHIAVDGPLAGRLLLERIVPNGGTTPPGANRMAVAEVEFAFRMARDLA